MPEGLREIDFGNNPEWLQAWYLENTWCGNCQASDLGMVEPKQWEEGGREFVGGKCAKCAEPVQSEVIERELG